MKKYYTGGMVKEADCKANEVLGIPGAVLMENAGRGAVDVIVRRYPEAERFLILCGPGNNGGDGFVIARHLAARGRMAQVIATTEVENYKGDAAVAAAAAERCEIGISLAEGLTDEEISYMISSADVVVDALLGTGSLGEPRGETPRLIHLCKDAAHLVSIDIPSGTMADNGEVYGCALSAELTVTFLAEKLGLAVTPGMLRCGDVELVDIGVPRDLVLDGPPAMVGFDRSDMGLFSQEIPRDMYKGRRGALTIVGGSVSFRGAPMLAARAALRAGCGYVYLAVPDFLAAEASAAVPEAIVVPLNAKDGFIRYKHFERILAPWLEKSAAVVVGPGLGRLGETDRVVSHFHRDWKKPLLLDADALYHLLGLDKLSFPTSQRDNLLITPHNGEAGHLLDMKSGRVATERLTSCTMLAQKYGNVLLKGPNTLVFSRSERRVILEGGPELSVPGSGDVLSGAIGAYLARGMNCIDAATLGALVHGVAGGQCGRKNGVMASEIADRIGTESV